MGPTRRIPTVTEADEVFMRDAADMASLGVNVKLPDWMTDFIKQHITQQENTGYVRIDRETGVVSMDADDYFLGIFMMVRSGVLFERAGFEVGPVPAAHLAGER